MKFVSLVFNYDLDKMSKSGRIWGKEGYRNQNYIFEYSAASIATVLDKNPHIDYDVWTDNAELLFENISKYNVNTSKLNVINKIDKIKEYSTHDYCFWPAVKIVDDYFKSNEQIIKLDNDLTCLKKCDDLFSHDGALVWKHERNCSKGRHYWGESFASKNAFGTSDFEIYNIGVFALSKNYYKDALEIPALCQSLLDIDISSIVRFPESESTKVKMWSCSEQTADSYFINKHNINVLQTTEWFDHHCYSKTKQGCIDAAKKLLK